METRADAEVDAEHGALWELQAHQKTLESREVAPALVPVLQQKVPRNEKACLLGVRSLGGNEEEVVG